MHLLLSLLRNFHILTNIKFGHVTYHSPSLVFEFTINVTVEGLEYLPADSICVLVG
jgi:hypothetical protein